MGERRGTVIRTILKCVVVVVACLSVGVSLLADSSGDTNQPCLTSFFTKSLHYTGEGMRRWYEEEGSFMEITKIPCDQLNCKKCHVTSCDQCHAKKKGTKLVFSPKKARDINTCLPCHGREGLTFRFDGVQGKLKWAFLNKTEKGWVQVSNKKDPMEQYAAYGTPLTEEQFTKMAQEVTPEDFKQTQTEQSSIE